MPALNGNTQYCHLVSREDSDSLIVPGTIAVGGVSLSSAVVVPAFTVADATKQLTVSSTNQTSTITPSDVDAAGGGYLVTIDGEDTAELAYNAANTAIAAAIELAVPALDGLVTVTGDISDATFTIEFLDARPHTASASDIDLTGTGAPYTFGDEITTPAVAEHLAWATA